MNTVEFLKAISPFSGGQVVTFRSRLKYAFWLKDVYTDGLAVAKRKAALYNQVNDSLDITRGYTLLDEAEDEESGRPVRDYYLWAAMARLMISAGDLVTAAVNVEHIFAPDSLMTEGGGWRFSYVFERKEKGHTTLESKPFLTLFPVTPETTLETFTTCVNDATLAPEDHPIAYRTMGPIDPTQFIAKLGAYPLAVHPKLVERAIAVQLHGLLMGALVETGLQVLQHWQPVDTSVNPAIYYLSDGADPYVMVYDAPVLRDCLIEIDAAVGRTEADGAIVADAVPTFIPAPPLEEELAPILQVTHEHDDEDDPLDEVQDDQEAQQAAFGQPDYLG